MLERTVSEHSVALLLELKIRDHADQICVSASFSDSIEGALDLIATRIDR